MKIKYKNDYGETKEIDLGWAKWVIYAVILLFVLGLFNASTTVVDEGQQCAITSYGKVTGEGSPGLNFHLPFITAFRCFEVRDVVYETSEQPDQSRADYRDYAVTARTSDGQEVSVRYSVSYHVEPGQARYVYASVAQNMNLVTERVIKFYSRSIVRLTVQKYKAPALYSGDIFGVQDEIEKALVAEAAAKKIVIGSFLIRGIEFDPEYADTVEKKQIAFEMIETTAYETEQEKNRAQKAIEAAKGAAEAQIIQAGAEAKSIELRGQALARNPLVIQYEFVQNMGNVQWGIMPSNGAVPLLQIPGYQ